MTRRYYTFRIRISNLDSVHVEISDPNKKIVSEPSGDFGYKDETRSRIEELHQRAQAGELTASEVTELGEKLFLALFDKNLCRDFFDFYKRVRDEKALLRLELDVDERKLPDVAALPWEFMCVPQGLHYGTLWLSTSPSLVFSRRRASWNMPRPTIKLRSDEYLRLALVVAAPSHGILGPVKYEEIAEALTELANDQSQRIKLLPIVSQATPTKIDDILEQEPHILHFIGHARFKDQDKQDTGQIALVDDTLGEPMWVDAERFGELFNRHQPSVVLLQACESAVLSTSAAFVGLASQIVDQNIPVVVAMQHKISNSVARRFALEFYRRLAEDNPVDKATQEGRRRISLGPTGYTTPDFATPVLFMRVRDGYLFQRGRATSQAMDIGRILVIEDDERWRTELQDYLVNEDYKVDAVADYEQAISILQKNRYFAATIDMQLEEVSTVKGGYKLLKYIKNHYPQIRCIIVSGADLKNREVRNLLKQYGADDFIGKNDFNLEDFISIVKKPL